MTANAWLMQIQADLLSSPVIRPSLIETTCFGAAYAAGIATGYWDLETMPDSLVRPDRHWEPQQTEAWRVAGLQLRDKAVSRATDWIDRKRTSLTCSH